MKNILLLFFYRLLCFRYLGGSGLELTDPETFNIDEKAFNKLKIEVANAPHKQEVSAATKLMIFNLVSDANKNNTNFLIPSQEIERLHPGDFHVLDKDNSIFNIIELKYISKYTTYEIMPTIIHLLKTNLYGDGNDILYGVSKEFQKELLKEQISEIQSSNRSELFYKEIISNKNDEYLTGISKKKMLKEYFKGRLTSEEIHQIWELKFKEDLSKHINIDETTTTKQFRKAMLYKDSWDNLALENVLKEKHILESIKKKGCTISELDRFMLVMTDDRTNFNNRKIEFGGNITVTNVNEIPYTKSETSKQVLPNNTTFITNLKYFLKGKKLK